MGLQNEALAPLHEECALKIPEDRLEELWMNGPTSRPDSFSNGLLVTTWIRESLLKLRFHLSLAL